MSQLAPSATFGLSPLIDPKATADDLYVKILPVKDKCRHHEPKQTRAQTYSKDRREQHLYKRLNEKNNPEQLLKQKKYANIYESSQKMKEEFKQLLESFKSNQV